MDLSPKTFVHQLKANAVAIISLFVALSALPTIPGAIRSPRKTAAFVSPHSNAEKPVGVAAGGGLRALPEKPAAWKPHHRLKQGIAHQALEPDNPRARPQGSGALVSNLEARV